MEPKEECNESCYKFHKRIKSYNEGKADGVFTFRDLEEGVVFFI